MKSTQSLFATVLLLLTVPVAAHDGHDEVTILTGKVIRVENQTIQLETFDQTMMRLKNVSILIDAKTKFLLGKKRVQTLELAPGHRIEIAVRSEHARDDSIRLRGLQIRLDEPKKPASTLGT